MTINDDKKIEDTIDSNPALDTSPSKEEQEKEHLAAIRAHELNYCRQRGLFNRVYYEAHCGAFPTEMAAFEDYLHKSTFSNVNPSALFDTEGYQRANIDVYHAGTSPLLHYIYHGEKDKRRRFNAIQRWVPNTFMVPKETKNWSQQSIAICLHVFYPDFIEKFANSLSQLPCSVDVFVTCASKEIEAEVKSTFSTLNTVNKVTTAIAPNQGRNFGPFLVEFSKQLLEYDLMCHLHSKKSLYSGREQTQWFDYLHQYLLADRHVLSCILRLFDEHKDLGMYYPTSFWMMPSWVNHWTCNKSHARPFIDEWGIEIDSNFLSYPVGGMFWARPKALKPLFEKEYEYQDFPVEPLPNDGSYLHALERAIGLLVEKQGYQQFFYHPPSAKFTVDKTYAFTNYAKPPHQLLSELRNFEIISFDVFDTILRREYIFADYAKFQVGKHLVDLDLVSSPEAFVELRNESELQCRKNKNFVGDVDIVEVYTEVAQRLHCETAQAQEWMQMEFEYDLQSISGKDEMVNLVNQLSDVGREIWFVSDTYYTEHQISLMLRHIGISVHYKLFVSSELGLRKDNGSMWKMLRETIDQLGKSIVHVGDNVISDAQVCGDYGFTNMHILHPEDKWLAAGMKPNAVTKHKLDETDIIKWGSLMSKYGRYPLFGN